VLGAAGGLVVLLGVLTGVAGTKGGAAAAAGRGRRARRAVPAGAAAAAAVAAAATAAAAVATAAAAAARRAAPAVAGHGLEPGRHLLVGLAQQRGELRGDVAVVGREERGRRAHVARAAGTADAVHVVVHVRGQVVVDDLRHVRNV